MTVLSKQYTLVDLINLKWRDSDNFRIENKSRFGEDSFNHTYGLYYAIAKSYPLMSWIEFVNHCSTKSCYTGCVLHS